MKTAFFSSMLLLSAPFFVTVEAVQLKNLVSVTTKNAELQKTQAGLALVSLYGQV